MSRRIVLPTPLDGVLAARRPTGVIVATILVVVAVFGGLLVPGLVYMALTGSNVMPAWMTIVAFGIPVAIVFLWVKFKEQRSIASLGFVKPAHAPKQMLRGAGIAFLLVTLAMLVLVMLGQGSLGWNGGTLSASGWALIAGWLGIFLVQGSSEEILLRGFVTQAYARRFGVVVAVVAQSLLFALLHAGNDGFGGLPVVNLVLVSILLACMVVADGSLWSACAFHACWNWTAGKFYGMTVSGQESSGGVFSLQISDDSADLLTGGSFGIEGSLLVTLALAGTILALIRPMRRAIARSGAGAGAGVGVGAGRVAA